MKAERAFILGVVLGVAGSLVPDIPTAIQMREDRPDLHSVSMLCYAALALAAGLCVWEIYKP